MVQVPPSLPCFINLLLRWVVPIQYIQGEKLGRIMSRSKNRKRRAERKLEKNILKTMHDELGGGLFDVFFLCFFLIVVAQGKAQCSNLVS